MPVWGTGQWHLRSLILCRKSSVITNVLICITFLAPHVLVCAFAEEHHYSTSIMPSVTVAEHGTDLRELLCNQNQEVRSDLIPH